MGVEYPYIVKEIEQGQNEELWQERFPGGKRF